MPEKRNAKAIINKAGGTAGESSVRYKVMLPSAWAKKMGISQDAPQLDLTFDGNQVIIRKQEDITPGKFLAASKAAGHDTKVYRYYHGDELCSTIYADFTTEQIAVEDNIRDIVHTAFGRNAAPTWNDFLAFLSDRCVPRSRKGINYLLQAMGLDEYDPVKIVKKTQGRMAEDKQCLFVSEES